MDTLKLLSFLIIFCLSNLSFAEPIIDLNSADAKTLDRALVGIGPVKAEAIIAYRQEHGLFKSINDLIKVKGINKKLINRNRRVMSVKFGAKPNPDTKRIATITWSKER